MKTFAIVLLLTASAIPACGSPRSYQAGKILAFDTGERDRNAKQDEIVYRVQVEEVIYKVTNHSKKRDFSAGEEVQCRVDKNRLIIEKRKGGEVKCDILGESVRQERPPGENP